MQIQETKLEGVLQIRLDVFEDFRGNYVETYNHDLYRKMGISTKFIQDDVSTSSKNVLRGIHGDAETTKLVSCLCGAFYLVVVNNDANSKQYRSWQGFTLSDRNSLQILIPPKFGNGHLILSKRAIFHYKQDTNYNPSGQFTIKWNDPTYGIWWPHCNPILSRRDEEGRIVD